MYFTTQMILLVGRQYFIKVLTLLLVLTVLVNCEQPLENNEPLFKSWIISFLDDATNANFNTVYDWVKEKSNHEPEESAYESYTKFIVANLTAADGKTVLIETFPHHPLVAELTARSAELAIEEILEDDMPWKSADKSEL